MPIMPLLDCHFSLFLLVISFISHRGINILLLLASLALAILFLSAASMVLGGLFRNPNIASPAINMLYMVIVMVTPFYSDLAALSQPARLAYCFNPFAHATSLIGGSFGQPMLCDPLISAAILFLLTAILGALSVKRWYSSHAAEKLGVF